MRTTTRQTDRLCRALGRVFCVTLVLAITGCIAQPPVQEMSDARQAIAVAREAGADISAAEDFRAAEAYLDSAQRKLTERSYAEARRDAEQAKSKALDALAIAEQSKTYEPRR